MTPEELLVRLADPGFTPGVKAVPALVELIARGEENGERAAAAALSRVQVDVVAHAARALGDRGPNEQRRVLYALARRAGREDAALLELAKKKLASDERVVRIGAARILGRVGGEEACSSLETVLKGATDGAERRALLEAIAKTGAERAAAIVAAEGADEPDPKLARASLIAHRSALRQTEASEVRLDVPLGAPHHVVFRCRRGLEEIVAHEVEERVPGARSIRIDSDGRVGAMYDGPLAALGAVRTAIDVALVFSTRSSDQDLVQSVASLVTSPDLAGVLRRLTTGPIRYRLAWADGGKSRKITWDIASAVRARAEDLINDPTQSPWQITVSRERSGLAIDLAPNAPDPRFTYREADVPAASHPTIAAALVRVSEPHPEDVVWDPFVGSGLELCERAVAAPYERMVGTDRDRRAIDIAKKNLARVGAERVHLDHGDARGARIAGLTAVITNPPMGRRVLADTDLDGLLHEVILCAARSLEGSGRIVLLSPRPATTSRAAREAGLTKVLDRAVDMGGFDAVLQRFDKTAEGGVRTRAEDGSAGPRRSPRQRG